MIPDIFQYSLHCIRTVVISIWIVILLFDPQLSADDQNNFNVDTSRQAMVVAARVEAVAAGQEMLRQGGNAVDAAVAAAFVIGVVEPYASGLGGGGGMLIYQKKEQNFAYLDYYVQAPASIDSMTSPADQRASPRGICIPGTPSGLLTALQQYGRLPRPTVIQPAIKLASQGFVVNDVFFEAVLEKLELIMQYPTTAYSYLKDQMPYMAGDTIRMTELAGILANLADKGEDYFYRGDFATRAAAAIREGGGLVSPEDFSAYHTLIRKPLSVNFRGYDIFSAAPPQSGVTVLEILKMIEIIDPPVQDPFEENALSIHLLTEAIRRADADRFAFLADPRFVQIPLAGLLNSEYIRQRISDADTASISFADEKKFPVGDPWKYQQTDPSPVEGKADRSPESPHTTHISVIDGEGNMVSLTQTLGVFFGCGFSMDGVIFNSGISNFSREGVNRLEPSKRPRSTIAPTIIMKDDQPFAVLGTPGGGTIFNVMAELIIRLIDFKESPLDAVYGPRFSNRVTNRQLTVENRFDQKILDDLIRRGYDIRITDPFAIYLGGVQLIYYDQNLNSYIGVSDPRRGGVAGGL